MAKLVSLLAVIGGPGVAAFAPASVGRTFARSSAPLAPRAASDADAAASDAEPAATSGRREFGTQSAMAAGAVGAGTFWGGPSPANALFDTTISEAWEKVTLPVATTLYDIAFDSPEHGYVVGAKGTFLETIDGGKTWEPRSFSNLDAEEEINYRFEKVSFKDKEGWVIGKPPVLLHTTDAGKSWERVPLSPKLPGEPSSILALGASQAEMTTSAGAVYITSNAGRNWKAQVKETIDATLNRISSSGVSGASYFTGNIISVTRDVGGGYLAISSRGNFYMTWSPGQDFWVPHNRGTPRRIQNMGFVNGDEKNGLWMTLNGGQLALAPPGSDLSADTPNFESSKINSGGYGIIDLSWRTADEVWACGGGGTLYKSVDGGKTFKFNNAADNIPGNLYQIEFFGPKTGFALGSDGVLLRYTGRA